MQFRNDCYPFEKHLEQLKLQYEYEKKMKQHFRERLVMYDEKEEIKKRDEQIDDLHRKSLIVFSDAEYESHENFKNKHYQLHQSRLTRYLYDISWNGIGHCVKITCPICNESEDITDMDNW